MRNRVLADWAMTRGVLRRLLKGREDAAVVAFVATEHAARNLARVLEAGYLRKALGPTRLDAIMNDLNRTLGKGDVFALKILFQPRSTMHTSIGVSPVATPLIDRIDGRNQIVLLKPGRVGPSHPRSWYMKSNLKIQRNEFTVLRAAEACMMRGTDRND